MRGPNNNRNVENYWEMLKYLYFELRSKRFNALDITKCSNIDNLYALVIATWCASLAKEGLYKEYVTIEDEELTSPKGQINIQETISRQSMKRGTIVCSYDELSEDIYLNHVLKGTLQYFLFDGNIDKVVKLEIQKTMQMFNGVGYVDINYIKWKEVKFNNSTMRYKHLLELCKTYLDEHKLIKNGNYDDDRRLYVLFKRQVIKYLDVTYGEDHKVDLFEMPFTLDNEPQFERTIFKTQQMVVVSNDEVSLVYMIRLQDDLMLRDSKIARIRLEEFVDYLREYKKEHKTKVFGTILYINIDERKLNLQPLTTNNVSDYMIGEVTLDIHDQWRFIINKINDAYKYFIERYENKMNKNRNNGNR
jgi:5-methylcytosine-specific restriction enzyme subunit McrC